MPNRLSAATSPYLLQHAENPVDWWEWGSEALTEARRRDVPILLSVGYAACHWCHVMAHESFEDPQIADLMNREFVNIKVDREERPDIDAVYLAATQAMTGQGGWPMTCFLTPTGAPFHCGTYYPPTARSGVPSFKAILEAVSQAWAQQPEELRQSADQMISHLNAASAPPAMSIVDESGLTDAAEKLIASADLANGGFSGSPKFPAAMALEFLLRHYERTGHAEVLRTVESTVEAMARGGIYDQLSGGFSRYSVDAAWVVPHFEKMLYDNALLLKLYAHYARRANSPLAHRIATETANFLVEQMKTSEDGFASSLDADTEGHEGLTYVWNQQQLCEVLGEEDGRWAANLFTVTDMGTFEEGTSTLQLLEDPIDEERFDRVREKLSVARKLRPQPKRDDKVITAWNGLAIGALIEAGAALGCPQWISAAQQAAEFVLDNHFVDNRLRRSSRDGVVGQAQGILEDYACLAEALLQLHQVTSEPRWLSKAIEILDVALDQFAIPDKPGAFFDTPKDAESLVHRPLDITDNATPAGASALASALLAASALVGSDRSASYREVAEQALSRAIEFAIQVPRFAGNWLSVAEAMQHGPIQVAVVGNDSELSDVDKPDARAELFATAARLAPGGAIVMAGEPDSPDVPLLVGRALVSDAPAAYVCRGYVCDYPISTVEELIRALSPATQGRE